MPAVSIVGKVSLLELESRSSADKMVGNCLESVKIAASCSATSLSKPSRRKPSSAMLFSEPIIVKDSYSLNHAMRQQFLAMKGDVTQANQGKPLV
jgi:hypothetical protein